MRGKGGSPGWRTSRAPPRRCARPTGCASSRHFSSRESPAEPTCRAIPACRARRSPPSSPASRPRAWSSTATPTGAAAGGGRPPALIALDPSAGCAIGIDFGKRHLAVALADLSHELLAEEWREMTDDYDARDRHGRRRPSSCEAVLEAAGADAGRVLGVGHGAARPDPPRPASSAPRPSSRAGRARRRPSAMAERLVHGGLRRQRRQPRRARRVHLGRRARRVRPRLPEGGHGHRRRAS